MRTPHARAGRRSGFALVIVTLFLLLFLALWGQAARQVGSMIRVEEARVRRIDRDKAALPAAEAMAQALAALEIGYPPRTPFPCRVRTIDGDHFVDFLVTYSRDDEHPSQWTIQVEPMPDTPMELLNPADFVMDLP